MYFKRNPEVIKAVQVDELLKLVKGNGWYQQPEWVIQAYENANLLYKNDEIEVNQGNTWKAAHRTDWIIDGPKMEIYTDEVFKNKFGRYE